MPCPGFPGFPPRVSPNQEKPQSEDWGFFPYAPGPQLKVRGTDDDGGKADPIMTNVGTLVYPSITSMSVFDVPVVHEPCGMAPLIETVIWPGTVPAE